MVPRVTYSCIQFVHVIHIALAIIPIISSYIVIIITKILRRLYNMYIIGSSVRTDNQIFTIIGPYRTGTSV